MEQRAYELALGAAVEARPNLSSGNVTAVVKAAIAAYEQARAVAGLPTLEQHIATVRREQNGLTEGERLAVEESYEQLRQHTQRPAPEQPRAWTEESAGTLYRILFNLDAAPPMSADAFYKAGLAVFAPVPAPEQSAETPPIPFFVDELTAQWLQQEYERQLEACEGMKTRAMLAALRKAASAEDDVREALQSSQGEVLTLESRLREATTASDEAKRKADDNRRLYEESQREVERLRMELRATSDTLSRCNEAKERIVKDAGEQIGQHRSRAEAAEAELAKLRALMSGLVDKWGRDLLTYPPEDERAVAARACLSLAREELQAALKQHEQRAEPDGVMKVTDCTFTNPPTTAELAETVRRHEKAFRVICEKLSLDTAKAVERALRGET